MSHRAVKAIQAKAGRAATRGGKRGRRPLNKNSAHLKCPACPPKLPFPLRQFEDGGFFFENQNK